MLFEMHQPSREYPPQSPSYASQSPRSKKINSRMYSFTHQTASIDCTSRRMTLLRTLTVAAVLAFVLVVVISPHPTNAQSSYNNNNDNDNYGYDNEDGGYDPQPPPVVDNLYHNYAARQEAKVGLDGGVGGGANGGGILGGWVGTGLTFVTGWMAGGYYHSRSTTKKLNIKFKKEQKELYQQYYNDVYALQQQNNELINALEQYLATTQPQGTAKSSTSNAQQGGQRRIK